jgi:tetratricopeptide (TPR) repeat protein
MIADVHGRHEEARALLEQALSVAREHEVPRGRILAVGNLAESLHEADEHLEARSFDLEYLALARDYDSPTGQQTAMSALCFGDVLLGDWDEALAIADEQKGAVSALVIARLLWLLVQRGEIDRARRTLEENAGLAHVEDVHGRAMYTLAEAIVLRAEGHPRQAIAAADQVIGIRDRIGVRADAVKLAFVEAVDASFALGDLDRVEELLGEWEQSPFSSRTPFVEAHLVRLNARLAAAREETDAAARGSATATILFRGLSMPFDVALSLLEQGEYLVALNRAAEAEPLFAEARETFHRLQAKPWVARTVQAQDHQQTRAQS